MEDSFVEPDTAALLAQLAALGGPKLSEMAVADARAAVRMLAAQLDLPCEAPCAAADIPAGDGPPVPSRLYTPAEGQAGPVILYAHGGGWVLGDVETYDRFCRHLATVTGRRVLAPDYRLAPEHPFPAAHDDVVEAARWLAGSPEAVGAKVTGIALAGDSAGGALAATAALDPRLSGAKLLALLLLFPVTDLSRTTLSYARFAEGYLLEAADMAYFAEAYAPDLRDRRDPRLSPLLAPDLAGLPPVTILTCGLDVLRDEGRAFAAALVSAGVETAFHEAPGQIHGVAIMRGALASARRTLAIVLDEFSRRIERRGSE
jgi:acetyl esterase